MSDLKRLVTLYGLVERARAAEAALAQAAVNEVHAARNAEMVRYGTGVENGRAAMLAEDAAARTVALAEEGSAAALWGRLAPLQLAREKATIEALEAYRVSRLETEQMRSVADRERTLQALAMGRRAQAEADDRYSSRREWMRAREGISGA